MLSGTVTWKRDRYRCGFGARSSDTGGVSDAPLSAPRRRSTASVIRTAAAAVTAMVLVTAACSDRGGDLVLSEQAARGQSLYRDSGCAGCHGGDGGGGAGPTLVGIRDTERPLLDGTTVIADQDYLIRSIMEPHIELVDGYSLRMPSNNLSLDQVLDVIAFIDELDQQP